MPGRLTNGARLERVLGLTCLVVAMAVFVAVMMAAARRGAGYDLLPLAVAGRLVASGQAAHLYAQDPQFYNLTGDPAFREAARAAGTAAEPTPFVYPPLVAVLMRPLAAVPFAAISRVWAALSVLCVFAGLFLTVRLYLPSWNTPVVWAGLLLALCWFEPVLYGFWLGQTTAAMLPMVMGALALQRRGRDALAGLLLACAVFIKLTPAVIAVVWLWRGPRRAFLWTIAGVAVLWIISIAAAGLPLHAAYVHRVTSIGRIVLVSFNNQSLSAVLGRLQTPRTAWLDWRMYAASPAMLVLHTTALAVMAATAVYAVRRTWREQPARARAFTEGFALLFMLLAPNIAWTHYFVFLLPVIAIVMAWAGRPIVPRIAAAIAFAVCCRPLLAPQDVPAWAVTSPLVSGPAIAALVLWGALLWIAPARGASR